MGNDTQTREAAMPIDIHRDTATQRADYTIDQNWDAYTAEEHAVWATLFKRQVRLLKDRVVPVFLDHVDGLAMAGDGIPDFRRLNDILHKATGWTVVAVPGLVPDATFFEQLANRRFPSTCFIRTPEELDYLEEPDTFHDVFVPLLLDPMFADYMQEYGKGGLKADGQGALKRLARLYWYTVEFGLTRTPDGLRIYGAGIASSAGETVFALEDRSPNRVAFDLDRVMRTDYRIDDYQETYFVIPGFRSLMKATEADFTPIYARLDELPDIPSDAVTDGDHVLNFGTGKYHRERQRKTA
jgi:phenylalanine-4-hydroxylase